jgi:hypothetical protein
VSGLILDLLLSIVWLLLLSFFEEENDQEGESKESKIMVMADIFWYLMLFCGIQIAIACNAKHTQLYMD